MKVANKGLLNPDELCALLGISREAVTRWQSQGIPFTKAGRAVFFDRAKIAPWFAERKRLQKYVFMLAPPDVPKPAVGDSETVVTDALAKARWGTEQAYRIASQFSDNVMYQEHLCKCIDTQRKLELDWHKIQLSTNAGMPKDRVMADVALAFAEVQQALMAQPQSQSPMLANKSDVEVCEIWTRENRLVLKRLAETLKEKGLIAG